MLSGMVLPVLFAALLGAVVARSVVAEADAHRHEAPDRWFGPVCEECGSGLGPVLASCRRHGHTQRITNVVVLVVTVVLSGLIPAAVPSLWLMPAYLVFLWVMILLTVTDLDTKLIPNRILGPATMIGVALLVPGHFIDPSGGDLIDGAIGGVSYFVVMFLLALIVKGGLGFGDVKLAFIIGVFVGYLSLGHVLVAGMGSFLIGGAVAAFLLITRRQGRKDAIPFGPFMTTAAVVALFFGQDVINWYLG
jgi:leader peptidase (prepilin peptidase)/N-methyltransferase